MLKSGNIPLSYDVSVLTFFLRCLDLLQEFFSVIIWCPLCWKLIDHKVHINKRCFRGLPSNLRDDDIQVCDEKRIANCRLRLLRILMCLIQGDILKIAKKEKKRLVLII